MSTDAPCGNLNGVLDVPNAILSTLLSAFEACHVHLSERKEFMQLRTQLVSEAAMYSRHVHPKSLEVVDNIRATMERFSFMHEVKQLKEDSKFLLDDCNQYRGKVDRLVKQHAFVLANLKNMERNMKKEEKLIEESTQAIFKSAEKHMKEAQRLRTMARAAVFLPPVAGKLQEEAKTKDDIAATQRKDVDLLKLATNGIRMLFTCHSMLYQLVHLLASALNTIMTEIHSVLSAGRSVDAGSGTAERGFELLKNSAIKVIRQCDTFLDTRISYPTTMISIGANESLTPSFETDWEERYRIAQAM